ncbi:MAG: hypothetical protein ACK5MR_02370 [Cumulibacter sp.]
MPGEDFYPGQPGLGTMRLNFSHASPADTNCGLHTLAQVLRDWRHTISACTAR